MAKKILDFYKNVLDSKSKSNILHNVYLLYIIFAIAIADLFYLLMGSKWMEMFVFFAVGILVSFFSKNMVVILILCMVVAFIFSNGAKSLEGFDSSKTDSDDEDKAVTGEEVEGEQNDGTDETTVAVNSIDVASDKSIDIASDKSIDIASDKSILPGMDGSKLSALDTSLFEDAGISSLKVPQITPFEVTDQSDIHKKIDELMNRQKVLIEKMNEHKPVLESISSLGKSLGMIK